MKTKIAKSFFIVCLILVFLACIILGQKTVGLFNLGIQLFGLVGLLTMLYFYNKKFT